MLLVSNPQTKRVENALASNPRSTLNVTTVSVGAIYSCFIIVMLALVGGGGFGFVPEGVHLVET